MLTRKAWLIVSNVISGGVGMSKIFNVWLITG